MSLIWKSRRTRPRTVRGGNIMLPTRRGILMATAGWAAMGLHPRFARGAMDKGDQLLKLHSIIRPRPGEAVWSQIDWLTDLWDARRRAAKEAKPIFVWSASGDPIGCT
jgi:hypothetical protein